MPEAYATSTNQKTGRRESYKTKGDYLAGRATKAKSARQRTRRAFSRV